MDYEVVEKINFNKSKAKRIGAFWYDPETDGLLHESPWWFPVQLLISHGLTKCQVTPMMLILPFLLKGWINVDILLRQIELLKEVQKDTILMHGSCVGETLIVGFPNAGKTYETLRQVSKGGKFISEEYSLIYRGNIERKLWCVVPYKNPMRSCFSESTLKVAGMKMSLREKIWMAAAKLRAKLFPFMYEAVIWRKVNLNGDGAQIKKIVYGSTGREVTDWKEFAILCENEFPFMSSEFLQAYAVVSGFDILGIQEKQRQLIKEFVHAVYPNSVKV